MPNFWALPPEINSNGYISARVLAQYWPPLEMEHSVVTGRRGTDQRSAVLECI